MAPSAWVTPRSAPRAADGTRQRGLTRPCAEQAQRNRVYLVTAVLPTPQGPVGIVGSPADIASWPFDQACRADADRFDLWVPFPQLTESAQVTRRGARPTRITVDLVAELHSFLRGYAQARDVAAADVIRELIRQVRTDPDLSARVTAELERRREALAEAMRAARE